MSNYYIYGNCINTISIGFCVQITRTCPLRQQDLDVIRQTQLSPAQLLIPISVLEETVILNPAILIRRVHFVPRLEQNLKTKLKRTYT